MTQPYNNFVSRQRRGLYYCFNILFPSVLLLGVTMVSFYIPTETGEKVNIPVTMFLSQSFLLFAITQYMPVQSDVIPAIGRWVAHRRWLLKIFCMSGFKLNY